MTPQAGDERPASDQLPSARLSYIGRLYRRLHGLQGEPPNDGGSRQHTSSGPALVDAAPDGRPELFERLSCAGRVTLDAAQEEARILGHRTVGTEHILLALTRNPESGACKVMERMGATPAGVRAEVAAAIVTGPAPTSGPLVFTPRARLAVELAHRAAFRIGVPRTGTEHLLIGLAAEREGIAAKALFKSGIVARTVEHQVIIDLDGKRPLQ